MYLRESWTNLRVRNFHAKLNTNWLTSALFCFFVMLVFWVVFFTHYPFPFTVLCFSKWNDNLYRYIACGRNNRLWEKHNKHKAFLKSKNENPLTQFLKENNFHLTIRWFTCCNTYFYIIYLCISLPCIFMLFCTVCLLPITPGFTHYVSPNDLDQFRSKDIWIYVAQITTRMLHFPSHISELFFLFVRTYEKK